MFQPNLHRLPRSFEAIVLARFLANPLHNLNQSLFVIKLQPIYLAQSVLCHMKTINECVPTPNNSETTKSVPTRTKTESSFVFDQNPSAHQPTYTLFVPDVLTFISVNALSRSSPPLKPSKNFSLKSSKIHQQFPHSLNALFVSLLQAHHHLHLRPSTKHKPSCTLPSNIIVNNSPPSTSIRPPS